MTQEELAPRAQLNTDPQQSDGSADLQRADIDIGIMPFSGEHRSLLEQVTVVCQAVVYEKPFEYLKRSLTSLLAITQRHFEHEEDYMRRSHYADLDSHADDHRALERQLTDFIEAVTNENSTATDRLYHAKAFFEKWLIDHILKYDEAYARFMGRAGASDAVQQ